MGLSVATMLLTAAIAPVISRFFGELRLALITLALAVGFIFSRLAVQYLALLSWKLSEHKPLTLCDPAEWTTLESK